MKKCEYFKDLLLTDYLDGQLDEISTANMEGHLLDCSDCRAFLKEVKETVAPLERALRLTPPAELWQAVKQGLEEKQRPHGFWDNFVEGLRGWMVVPRLVPILATMVLMVLAGGISLNTIRVDGARERSQGEYLMAVIGSAGAEASSDNNNLGTPIEQYFL
jgi:anti-sigma factor RsiW